MTYVISAKDMSEEEIALVVFLQGVVNRGERRLFLDVDNYLEYAPQQYQRCGVWEALAEYVGLFDGLAVYDLRDGDVAVNLAATVCAAGNSLGVPRALLEKVRVIVGALPVLFDAADVAGSDAERQRAVWLQYRDKLRKDSLVHQVTEGHYHIQLRDQAIASRVFTFFARPERDEAFLNEVLDWADRIIPVYGWTTDEIAFVKKLSQFGDYIVPADWSHNHSYTATDTFTPVKQRCKDEKLVADEKKHYLAIVVSDGDNVQWFERDFSTDSHYGQRRKAPVRYKMSWTAPPLLSKICPAALQKIYGAAEADTFICGVSGIGYTNCMTFPRALLSAYAEATAEGMKNADMRVLALLDNVANTKEGNAEDRLAEFAKHEQIAGGIWQLDPDRYESGKGKIWFVNGKPFISVGISMWHPSCSREGVTEEWLDGIAAAINARPIDIRSENGYTVLNVHPWSTDMQMLDHVVSRLAEHVEIVSAGELIDIIGENVRR